MAIVKVYLSHSSGIKKNPDIPSWDSTAYPNEVSTTILQDYGTNNYCRKSLMKFDVSAYSVAQLANVKLKIHVTKADQVGTFNINKLKRTDWDYTYANKTYYKSGSAWGTIMASNTSTDIETSSPAQITTTILSSWANTWVEFDLSSIAQDAKNNNSGIINLLLWHSPIASGTGVVVYDDNGNSDVNLRPYLEINISDSSKFLQMF